VCVNRSKLMPISAMVFAFASWNLFAIASGETPSFSALTVIGAPCMSEPDTISVSFPTSLLYLAKISLGRNEPVMCPTCIRPFAYGHAQHTSTRTMKPAAHNAANRY
jgi:hypothetical protein